MENIAEYLKEERSQPWRDELRKSKKAKERTSLERIHMPEQDPEERSHNYLEVNLGLTEEQALVEASRCLDCPDPTCITGCPVGINIPKFIKKIEAKDYLGAAVVLKETNALPAVCGRVCPQEVQCEANCFYTVKLKKTPVAIGNLERFAADYERNSGKISVPEISESNGIKVAVIGSGPAGLAAAGDLAKFGYEVTVFEALHEIGGVLKYGIPEYRLPNEVIDVEIESLRKMGVRFRTNFVVGKTASIDDLRKEGYEAFFVGSGAGLPGIPLALARPQRAVTLIDSVNKKTRFQRQAIRELGLEGRVTAVNGRVEALGDHHGRYPVVIARAFAPLARLCRLAGPLLAPGGWLLAMKGPRVDGELAELPDGWSARVHRLPGTGEEDRRLVIMQTTSSAASGRNPR